MTMATCIDQPSGSRDGVLQLEMISNGVHTCTIRTIRTSAGACCPWRGCVFWPLAIAWDRLSGNCKCWRDVVFPCIGLGLVIDPLKVQMRRLACLVDNGYVLLEPETKLHVIAQQFGTDLLVRIQHDAPVTAAAEPTYVLLRVACGVALRQQITCRCSRVVERVWRHAGLHKLVASDTSRVAQLARSPGITDARGRASSSEGDERWGVHLVVCKHWSLPNCCDQMQRRHAWAEAEVLRGLAQKRTCHYNSAHAIHN
mmetsp:Transcript_103380/g.194435  ORF Transcript_103380/g.194435 Transcript_103380/m.194435 type:complete len:256 (-) Transcript_103380:882-1649(-)